MRILQHERAFQLSFQKGSAGIERHLALPGFKKGRMALKGVLPSQGSCRMELRLGMRAYVDTSNDRRSIDSSIDPRLNHA